MNISDPRPSKNSNDPPSAKIWNMKWFAYLAAPLLSVTIILPILAGPIFRQLLQWYIRLRNFWRVGFIIFWILFTVATYVSLYRSGFYGFGMLIIYDSSIVGVTTGRVYFAFKAARSRQGGMRHLVLNVLLVAGAAGSFMVDLVTNDRLIMGTFAWIALPLIMYYEYRLDAQNTKTPTSKKEQPN